MQGDLGSFDCCFDLISSHGCRERSGGPVRRRRPSDAQILAKIPLLGAPGETC